MKMPWYSACLLLLFLFRTNGKKGRLDENDFRQCHGIFFESGILKVTWSQLCSKFLSNKYEAHWKQHFERYPRVEYFPDMDQLTGNMFHQDFGKHETKIDDSALKKHWHFLDIFVYKFIHLFAFCLTYDYCDIEVYPVPLLFFITTRNIFMSVSVPFLKIFSFKMSLLCSYFSRKIVTC